MEDTNESDALSCAIADHTAQAEAITAELEEFFRHVRARHAHVLNELLELSAGLPYLCLGLHSMRESCRRLEEIYTIIDQLQSTMDRINELILIVFSAVKAIDSAPDVTGKTYSLLTSIGVVLHSERVNAGLWSRVPRYAMLNSRTTTEFLESVHDTFKVFHQTRE